MATIVVRHDHLPVRRDRETATLLVYRRLILLLLAMSALTAAVVLRLVWMGIAVSLGGAQPLTDGTVPPRADIVDRNGVPLARTIDGYAIAVRPGKVIGDPRELARALARILPEQTEAYYLRLITGRKWAYLRKRALPEQVAAVNALGEPGFEFPREKERLYPQRTLAAHVLGFVPSDTGGGMGVEGSYNDRLIDPAMRGQPLTLSLDSRVQGVLESELYAQMVDQRARGAAGVILDANTGEVLAMASLPVFDPNKISGDVNARRNVVVQARFELGSTFKPLSIAAAMDNGTVTSMGRRYDAMAPLKVGDFTIRDEHPMNRWLNVPETLVYSSNIVTARIADELGSGPLQRLYRALEFDRRPSVGLHEATRGIWPSSWGRATNMTAAYGHGIAVTPLHLASAYAALVNGGMWHPATVLRLREDEVPEGRRVFSAATSARMRQLLRMIVAAGTGRQADAPGYRVGGKTGSAEKPDEGGYNRTSLVTTFAAAFPMDNPKYVMLVMMDEPQGGTEHPGLRVAAFTAAPVVKRVVERIGPMLGVIPDQRRDVDISELMPLLWKPKGEQ